MILDEKLLDDLEITDVYQLINQEICESPRLDYKLKWWGNSTSNKHEMHRDISSFTNSYGGYIVLGVSTVKGSGAGDLECPKTVVGLERLDYSERVLRSCRDSLDPPCNGIEVKQVAADDDKVVVVIKIPQSLDAPHMVTFRGENRFWQRHGTDKQLMSTQEIRDMFMSRLSYQDQILQLAQQRVSEFREAHLDKGLLYVWAAPVVPMQSEVDLKNQELRGLFFDQAILNPPFGNDIYSGHPRACLDGMEAVNSANEPVQFIRLRRNGFLELGTERTVTQILSTYCIHSFPVSAILENFASFATQVYGRLGAQGPVALGCSFINVEGYKLYTPYSFNEFSTATWNSPILPLGHQVSYDFEAENSVIVKALSDRLWNAFHYDDCPYCSSVR